MAYWAHEKIVKQGLIDMIKNEEIKVITASLSDLSNKFAEILECDYSDYMMLVAVEVGSKKVVDLMINEFGIDVNKRIGNESALFHAISNKQLEMVEFLLKKGADIERGCVKGEKSTPLYMAIQLGFKDIVEVLIKYGANLNYGESNVHISPLVAAVDNEHEDLVKFFLDLGCCTDVLKAALVKACKRGLEDFVRLILDHPSSKETISLIDNDFDLLHNSILSRKKSVVKLILDRGVNVNAANTWNKTALLTAASDGNSDIIQLLLDKGADLDAGSINSAAYKGHRNAVKLFLNRGAHVDSKDKNGFAPLYAAALGRNRSIIKLLLNSGANFNVESISGRSVLPAFLAQIKAAEEFEFAKFLVIHMVQMKCENKFVSEKNWLATKKHEELCRYQQDIERELRAMKILKIADLEMCFYDVFKVQNDTKLLELAKNENVKKVMESDDFKFCYPIVHEIISKRFNNAIVEKELLDQLELFFLYLSQRNLHKLPKLARICVHMIASYLTVEDKNNVSSIVKSIAV